MKPRILLVEDNENNRYLARYLLERAGFALEVAVDGKRGLELARAGRFDLILMDIQLPGLDGLAVTRRLKDNPATRDIPTVALTAHATVQDRLLSLRALSRRRSLPRGWRRGRAHRRCRTSGSGRG